MKTKIKINRINIAYALIILPFFKPSAFVNYAVADFIFDAWRVLSMFYALVDTVLMLCKKQTIKGSLMQKYLWFYVIYMLVITIYNDSSFKQWALLCLAPVALIYWLEKWMAYSFKAMITYLYWIFGILIIANMATLIQYGDSGLYKDQYGSAVYLLGMRTRWTDVFFPAIGLMVLKQENEKEKKYTILSIVIFTLILVQIVRKWIASAILGFAIIFIVLLFCKIIKQRINILYLFFASLIFNILIVFFRIQSIFSWLLVNILHKDIGLNSRTMIWDAGLEVIKENWLLGVGITANTNFVSLYGGSLMAQGHSLIIQLCHDGGVVGLIIFTLVLLTYCQNVNKTYSKGAYLCGVIVVTSVILAVTEVYFYHIYIYTLLAIGTWSTKNQHVGEN